MISPGFLDKNEISKCSHLREHRDALKVSLYSEHFLISDCHEQGKTWKTSPLWAIAAFDSQGCWEDSVPSFQNIYPSHLPWVIQTLILADSQLLGSSSDSALSHGKVYVSDSGAYTYA